ncbi:hypothetical protein [Hamadaea flava]|uniref:hypothetical protein n=1 Tax=Hamadaea flava TaxID=1742688 RepID=UPI0020A3F6DB|nr:hypothetical protein [Hamadaea flava]
MRANGRFLLSDPLWTAWMRTFAHIDTTVADQPGVRCPSCGSLGLRLAWSGVAGRPRVGSLWCLRCRTGVVMRQSDAPPCIASLPGPAVDGADPSVEDFRLVVRRHDEPVVRRWARNTAAGLMAAMGLVLIAGVAAFVTGHAQVADVLLGSVLRIVFAGYAAASVPTVVGWFRGRRAQPSDLPASPVRGEPPAA